LEFINSGSAAPNECRIKNFIKNLRTILQHPESITILQGQHTMIKDDFFSKKRCLRKRKKKEKSSIRGSRKISRACEYHGHGS